MINFNEPVLIEKEKVCRDGEFISRCIGLAGRRMKRVVQKKILPEQGTVFAFYMTAIFFVYMMFMHPLMTSDYIPTYPTRNEFELIDFASLISGGRYMAFFINRLHWLLAKMHINYFENAYIMQFMGMILYAISCTVIFSLVKEQFADKAERIFAKVCILFSVVNPCVVETFRYNALDWAAGILFTVLSIRAVVQNRYVQGLVLGFLATSCYQSHCLIILVVSVGLLFIKNDNGNIKESFRPVITAVGISGMCALLNIGIQKIAVKMLFPDLVVVKDASLDIGNLLEHLHNILLTIKKILLEFYDMLPRNCLLYFAVLLLIPASVYLFRQRNYLKIIKMAAMLLAVIIVPFGFGIVTPVLWYAQRTVLAVFWGISILLLLIMKYISGCQALRNYTFVVTGIFALIVLFYTETCITDSFINQGISRSEAIAIQNEIIRYEDTSGQKVDTIVSRIGPGVNWVNNGLLLSYGWITYNQRMVVDSWAQGGYINYVNNTDYQCREMTEEEFAMYFENYRDWNSYVPSDQLHFEENVLYWVIY